MKKLRLFVALLITVTALFGAAAPKIEPGMKEAELLKLMGPPDKKVVFPGRGDVGTRIVYTWADLNVMVLDGEVDSTKAVDPKIRQQRDVEEKRREEEKRVAAEIVKKRRIAALENEIRRMEALLAPATDRAVVSVEEKAALRLSIEKAKSEIEALRKS